MPWDDDRLDNGLWDSVALWKSKANKRHVICRNLPKRLACSSPMPGVLVGLVTHYCTLLCFFPQISSWSPCAEEISWCPEGWNSKPQRLRRDSPNRSGPRLAADDLLNLLEVSHKWGMWYKNTEMLFVLSLFFFSGGWFRVRIYSFYRIKVLRWNTIYILLYIHIIFHCFHCVLSNKCSAFFFKKH